MAIAPTLSEEFYKNSVKKYFVDSLYTTEGVFISFEKLTTDPADAVPDGITEWIVFKFMGNAYKSPVSQRKLDAYLFSRGDEEGHALSVLRDKLVSALIDLTMPDGIRRAPLYDATWATIGGMLLTVGKESEEEVATDDTLYKVVPINILYAVS